MKSLLKFDQVSIQIPFHLQSSSSSAIYVKKKTLCMQGVTKIYYYCEIWCVAEAYQDKTASTNPGVKVRL